MNSSEGGADGPIDIGDHERLLEKYYNSDVVVIISMKIDTTKTDDVSTSLCKLDQIEDIFLVTGDIDIVAKARFKTYGDMREFIVDKVSHIDGIKETKTMVVVTIFKESGEI